MDMSMDLLQWSIIFYKKSAAYTSGGGIKNDITPNWQLEEELHMPVRKFKKRKLYFFKDKSWGTDIVDMHLISKYNRGICFLRFWIFLVNIYGFFLSKTKKL